MFQCANDINTRPINKSKQDFFRKNKCTADMFTILAKLKAEMRGKNPKSEAFQEKLNKHTTDNVDDMDYSEQNQNLVNVKEFVTRQKIKIEDYKVNKNAVDQDQAHQ
jgi:hypothetical protein